MLKNTIIQRENWALTLLNLFEVFPDLGFIFSLCNLQFLCYCIYLSQLQMHLSLYLLIVPKLLKYRKTMKNPELRTKNHLCCMEKYYVTSSKHEIFGQTFSLATSITSLYLSKVLVIQDFLTNLQKVLYTWLSSLKFQLLITQNRVDQQTI